METQSWLLTKDPHLKNLTDKPILFISCLLPSRKSLMKVSFNESTAEKRKKRK